MAGLSKPLTSALSFFKPEGIEKLAKDCENSAEKFEDAAKLLRAAAESYRTGDTEAGLTMLQHSQDRLNKKP